MSLVAENIHKDDYIVSSNTQFRFRGLPMKVMGIQAPSLVAVEIYGQVFPLILSDELELTKACDEYVEATKSLVQPPTKQVNVNNNVAVVDLDPNKVQFF